MKKSLLALMLLPALCMAQNPIIQTSFTPDPAPMVYGDKLYLFVDHDEDDATNYTMKDWQLYCTEDMVNWTYLGTPVTTATFPWANQGNRAWAAQCIERNGKFYWYVSITGPGYGETVSVAVADRPEGPYVDAIGGPLCHGLGFIDPTVFIDDDGQVYLFWGNRNGWYGRLNEDMISFVDGYKQIPGIRDPKAFGPLVPKMNYGKGVKEPEAGYEEGPWITKKGDLYYLTYPAGGIPEHMAYSTAPTPDGPWTYRGRIMDETDGSYTIHGGEVEYKGHHYMFYHNGANINGTSYHRSTCVEEFTLNPDGTIPFIPQTKEGVAPIGTLNPYERVEAETIAHSYGLKTDRLSGDRHYVTSIHNGDWIKIREVDFGQNPATLLTVETLNFKNAGSINFYIDDTYEQRPVASIQVDGVANVKTAKLMTPVTGKHDVYILFHSDQDGELFDFDWWKFNNTLNNPIIQTKYTADPAPMVYDGKVFLYTTHDADDALGFKMNDWLLYTSEDMVNWTDHGSVASLADFKWHDGDNGAWAHQVVERDGKFYMYCTIHQHGIGVLVADSPYGPFKDPIGKPLVWQVEYGEDIDPTVFIDDDGQAYMYWGNPNVYWAKLNKDMISIDGKITRLDYKIQDYQEGPWFYKRDGRYYLAFASTCCPEGIGYAMSDTPMGPWEYQGHIMDHTGRSRGNHPGIIDYKGKSYVFGLNYDLWHEESFGRNERRSVSVAELHYNDDGTIQEVPYWQDAVLGQAGTFDPFRKVEAETMAWGYGLKTETLPGGGIAINNVDESEYILIKGVDFGKKGARSFSASVRSEGQPAFIEIRLDDPKAEAIGTLEVKETSGLFKTQTCSLKGPAGVHDLYLYFRGKAPEGPARPAGGRMMARRELPKNLLAIDWWRIK